MKAGAQCRDSAADDGTAICGSNEKRSRLFCMSRSLPATTNMWPRWIV